MDEKQKKMYDCLCGMSGEDVINTITDYHGLQILDSGFFDHLVEEGYLEADEED